MFVVGTGSTLTLVGSACRAVHGRRHGMGRTFKKLVPANQPRAIRKLLRHDFVHRPLFTLGEAHEGRETARPQPDHGPHRRLGWQRPRNRRADASTPLAKCQAVDHLGAVVALGTWWLSLTLRGL